MPGRRSLTALLIAAQLGGCSGDVPLLGQPAATGASAVASVVGGATSDAPGFDPFQATAPGPAPSRQVIKDPSLADIMQVGELPEMALGSKDASKPSYQPGSCEPTGGIPDVMVFCCQP